MTAPEHDPTLQQRVDAHWAALVEQRDKRGEDNSSNESEELG